ncbi:MAG: DUF885 domain-containing protein [bacterium]|nr:DUF885 domain-containing protein [bacterium]MCP5068983.1 DUF885 domain-containing protein [bacterium]
MRRAIRVIAFSLVGLLLAATLFLAKTLWTKPFSIDHFFLREMVLLVVDHPMLLSFARVLEPYDLDYYSDELEDFSLEASRREAQRAQRALDGLREFTQDDLDPGQRVSHDILAWWLEHRIEGERFLQHAYPVNAFDGFQSFLPDFMVNTHQVNDLGDARNYLARLEAIPAGLDQLTERVETAAAAGILPPRFVLTRVREGLVELTETDAAQSPLVTKLKTRLPELSDVPDPDVWVDRARSVVSESIQPAYVRMDAALARLEAGSNDDAGVWKLPEGDAYYRWALRGHTSTLLTPDEVHQLGLREVARIHGEMKEVFAERGTPTETPIAALQALALEPTQRYPDTDEGRIRILADYQTIIDDVWNRLPNWFNTLPRAPVAVERVPSFRENGSAGAYYNPPPLDGSKPGIFYKNLANVEESPRFGMRTLAFHEAVPGHHMQIALAMENPDLPLFRRFLPFTAFVEGWALYAERLASEVGLLPTPADHLGQLQAENFRAVRLVVDTGLHAKRWSRDEAIEYMVAKTGIARSDVVREVERYVVAPGQACAYKIGQLKLLELRARARKAQGDAFDLKAFHDLVLGGGSRPLEILEQEVDVWIANAGE